MNGDRMSGHKKWSVLHDKLMARPGAAEAIARANAAGDEEIRQYERRHAEAMRKIDVAGHLQVTPYDLAAFESLDDVSISTLREYLDSIGARLELIAWFDEPDRRVPIVLV